ncbi:MAG: hypothetical protein ACKO0Z_11905 [Betaproteobacteria bacterium]
MKKEDKDALLGAVFLAAVAGYAYAWKVADVKVETAPQIVERIVYLPTPKPVIVAPASIPETSPTADDFLGMTSYPDGFKREGKRLKYQRGEANTFNKTRIGSVSVITIRK